MATTSTAIATVYSSEQDDGSAAWLLSLASGHERACSSPFTDGEAIARCAAVIKDAEANVYRRGLAVLALGRTLGREIGRTQSGDPIAIEAFRQECGGAGGVFDSLLDIVGQCTLSKAGTAPALLAGCGVADARNIRSNCCTLVSLLSSVLTMSNTTIPAGNIGATLKEDTNGDTTRREDVTPMLLGPTFLGTGTPLGGWDTFVPMNGTPSPDVVTLTRKKGWAARQPLLGSVAAVAGTISSKSRDYPEAYRNTTTRRGERGKKVCESDVGRSPLRRAASEKNTALKENSSRTKGIGERVPTKAEETGRRLFSGKVGFASPKKRPKDGNLLEACGASSSPRGRRENRGVLTTDRRNSVRDANGQPPRQGKVGRGWVDEDAPQQTPQPQQLLQPMSECPASPPKLSRIKDNTRSRLHTSLNGKSFSREMTQTATPLGLSTPGHQRNKAAKVFYTVSLPARKKGGDTQGGKPPPPITLLPGTAFERFDTQPPVRPSVLFGSDPVRELEMSNSWDKNNAITTDTNLGYQMPRLWFPQAQPGQGGETSWGEGAPISAGVSMPKPRSRGSRGFDRPIGSEAVVQEYQQMQAFRAYSALAMARPSSAEPLHGSDANAKLVATMGKRPEEEDAAIAQEWSPRGGRKLKSAQNQRRTCAVQRRDEHGADPGGDSSRACAIGRNDERGVDVGRDSTLSPDISSPGCRALLPHHRQQRSHARSFEVGGRCSGNASSLSSSPSGGCAKRPRQPPNDHSGHHTPLLSLSSVLTRRSQSGHHDDRQHYRMSTTSSDDEIFSNNSSDGGGDDSDKLMFGFSPEVSPASGERGSSPSSAGFPSKLRQFRGNAFHSHGNALRDHGNPFRGRGNAVSGNLGGQFSMLGSPYRTYRAKHARLLRARSCERAEAETRRAFRAGEEGRGGGASRSRSADSVRRRSKHRRREKSGMTSPLLKGEAFGLLQSKTTGKVSLGFQLPRDQLSATGRARAAAAALEERFHPSWAEQPILTSARSVGQTNKTEPYGHGTESISTYANRGVDREKKNDRQSYQSRSRIHHGGSSCAIGEESSEKEEFFEDDDSSCLPQRHRPRRDNRSGNGDKEKILPVTRRCFEKEDDMPWSSCTPKRGRSSNRNRCASEGRNRVSRKDRRRRGRRQQQRARLSESRKAGGGGGCCSSWSPPRTWARDTADLSPMMAPLDPCRGPLTVVRAGTLVSRRDAAEVERSSCHACRTVRWASEVREAGEKLADEMASRSPDDRGYRGRREYVRRRRGRRGRDAWVVANEDDANREDDVKMDRIKRLLPSVESMSRELRAIRRADAAMREEQLAQVQLNTNALPLALLLVRPGGAAQARDFIARALALWHREKTRARTTHALARWKIECEAQRFRERGLGYRTRFGALKIKVQTRGRLKTRQYDHIQNI